MKRKKPAFMETPFGKWLAAGGRAGSGEAVSCPSCEQGVVRSQYIGDLEARIGYLVAWCPVCLRGVHGCRVRIPDNVIDALPFDEATPEELRKRLPEKIEYITPK